MKHIDRTIRAQERAIAREVSGLSVEMLSDNERRAIAEKVAANLPERDQAAVTAAEAKRERRRERNLRRWNPEPTAEEYDTRARLVYLKACKVPLSPEESAELQRIQQKLANSDRVAVQQMKERRAFMRGAYTVGHYAEQVDDESPVDEPERSPNTEL